MDFHPIQPVEFDRHLKPLTGRHIQCNLNGFPPNLTTQFDQHLKPLTGIQCNLNGFPPNLTTQFDQHLKPLTGRHIQCNLNGFPPNLTSRIRLASKAFNRQAYNVISMDFHPIQPVEFDWHVKPLTGRHIQCNLNGFPPNLTSRIRLASKAFNRHTM